MKKKLSAQYLNSNLDALSLTSLVSSSVVSIAVSTKVTTIFTTKLTTKIDYYNQYNIEKRGLRSII